jgi:hypothetical protein
MNGNGDVSAPRPLVHVGYPKAASTWLQQNVWNNSSLGFCSPIPAAEIRRLLVWPPDLSFQSEPVGSLLSMTLQHTPNTCVPVLSEERLSGAAESGGHDAVSIAGRIRLVIPGGRVLIVIRRQADIIGSAWGQYVKYGGTEPLSRWLESQVDPFSLVPRFSPHFYEFDRLYEVYASLYGKDDVLVITQEQLRESAVQFVRTIQHFAAAAPLAQSLPSQSANARLDASVLHLVRLQNLFGRKPYGRSRTSLNPYPAQIAPVRWGLKGLAHASRTIPGVADRMNLRLRSEIADYVQDRFEVSNRKLQAATGLPLDQLGYPV